MKELSIEEKAKRYESSLERCRKLYNEAKANEYNSDIEDYETIFPELKESEDEKIKEAIISTIHLYYGEPLEDEAKEMLAWLEKQGEKKSQRMISAEAKEAMYDKPAWSEEDEQHIDSLLKRLDGLCRNEFERTRFAINEDKDWLESLKQRIGG